MADVGFEILFFLTLELMFFYWPTLTASYLIYEVSGTLFLSTRAATKKSRTKIDKNLVKDLLKFK
jgi:hypothetical protein